MKRPLNFDAMITGGAERWRDVGRALDSVEKQIGDGADDPAIFIYQVQTALAFVRCKQEQLQTYLRERFGVALDFSPASPASTRVHVIDEERAHPTTLAEVAHRLDIFVSLMTYTAAWWAMEHAIRQGTTAWLAKDVAARWWWQKYRVARPVLPPGYAAAAALRSFTYVMRNAPIVYATLAKRGERGDYTSLGLRRLLVDF